MFASIARALIPSLTASVGCRQQHSKPGPHKYPDHCTHADLSTSNPEPCVDRSYPVLYFLIPLQALQELTTALIPSLTATIGFRQQHSKSEPHRHSDHCYNTDLSNCITVTHQSQILHPMIDMLMYLQALRELTAVLNPSRSGSSTASLSLTHANTLASALAIQKQLFHPVILTC